MQPPGTAPGTKLTTPRTSYAIRRTGLKAAKKTLGDAGVSPKNVGAWELDAVSRIQFAAATVSIEDGTISTTSLRDVYAGRPELARLIDPKLTVADVFRTSGGTSAMATLGQGTIYVRPDTINYYGDGFLAATMLHELLHNVTGLTDPDLQRKLGLSDNGGSINITLRLMQDCL